jgi:TRAP-type uncharacterized transport system substrate-binding protein
MQEVVPSSYVATVQPTAATTASRRRCRRCITDDTMFVSADLPDDLVYDLTSVRAEQSGQMAESVRCSGSSTRSSCGAISGVPYHAGAIRYCEEHGIEQTELGG